MRPDNETYHACARVCVRQPLFINVRVRRTLFRIVECPPAVDSRNTILRSTCQTASVPLLAPRIYNEYVSLGTHATVIQRNDMITRVLSAYVIKRRIFQFFDS